MDYISTAQAAKKWGITPNRVFKLVSKGRIPGATKIGSMWMIPANAEKPIDGRTKEGKRATSDNEVFFRYAAFAHKNIDSFYPPLSEEELQIKATNEAFHACRFEEADEHLADLPETTKDKYIRISALFAGCMVDIALCNIERFYDRYTRLRAELEGDFPYKREMLEYLYIIDANFDISNHYMDDSFIDLTYDYHESFVPQFVTLCAMPLAFVGNIPTPSAMHAYEMNCILLKTLDAPRELLDMHVYLGVGYAVLEMNDKASCHIRAAFELAEKYEMFYCLSMHCYYYEEMLSPALADIPQELRKRVEHLGKDISQRFVRFSEIMRPDSIFMKLNRRDYILLFFAAQGYTNKEVAKILHYSTGTIGKRYSEIYRALGINNKKQLIKLYLNSRMTEDLSMAKLFDESASKPIITSDIASQKDMQAKSLNALPEKPADKRTSKQ